MTSHPSRRPQPLQALGAVLALLALTVLSACGTAASGKEGGKTVLRYQSGAGSVDVIQLASALGYLPTIKLEKKGDVTGGPQNLQALVSNEVDIATGPFFGATAQLVATGAPIKVVVSTYGSSGPISSSLVVPEKSRVTSARDLIGKKIAVNTLGANAEAVLDTWFEKEGLSPAEIKKVTLVALPPLNTDAALRQGKVDAAYLFSGVLAIALKRGGIREVFKDTDLVGEYNGGGSVLSERFIKQHPEATKEIATGIAKAVQFINTKGRDETLEVYVPWLEKNGYGEYVEAIEQNWAGHTGVPTKDASVRAGDISIWLDWLGTRGDVDPDKIKPEDVFTNEYNELAAS